jgi:phosphotransferase system enzyme I (PtsI)
VLELIGRVVEAGRRLGREVSLCGDMAGEPAHIAQLLRAGLRSLSVAPARLAGTKAAVAAWPSVAEAAHG